MAEARQRAMQLRWVERTALYRSFWAGVKVAAMGQVRVMSVM